MQVFRFVTQTSVYQISRTRLFSAWNCKQLIRVFSEESAIIIQIAIRHHVKVLYRKGDRHSDLTPVHNKVNSYGRCSWFAPVLLSALL